MAAMHSARVDPNQLSVFDLIQEPDTKGATVRRRRCSAAGQASRTVAGSSGARTRGRTGTPRAPEQPPPDRAPARPTRGQLDLGAAFLAALDDGALDVLAGRLAPRLVPSEPTSAQRTDDWLDARRGAAYVGLSLNALHKLTAARTIPFHQDGPGCKLWFRRAELDAWRTAGGARHWKRLRFQNASK